MRSIVRNITSYGNVLGWSGTNMRYVTITKSKFYNNGTGVVPNTLSSEKYPPEEDNVITDNDIFWNNFNYYAGAPFKVVKPAAADSTPYPVGVGVLLFGGRHNRVDNNRIYGNWLAGAGMIQQIILAPKMPEVSDLVGNQITNNQFGLNGTDLNGRDIAYDGNGSDNCICGNTGVAVTVPADASTFQAVPVHGRQHVQRLRAGRADQLGDRRHPRGVPRQHDARRAGRPRRRWCTTRGGTRSSDGRKVTIAMIGAAAFAAARPRSRSARRRRARPARSRSTTTTTGRASSPSTSATPSTGAGPTRSPTSMTSSSTRRPRASRSSRQTRWPPVTTSSAS